MKRIEDFTAEELNDVWGNAPGGTYQGFEVLLDYIKANLDTGKRNPMSAEEIRARTGFPIADCQKIQPLTVQQGFVLDWEKVQKEFGDVGVYGVAILACFPHGEFERYDSVVEFIPMPTPKMRQKTREEKIAEIVVKIGDNGMLWEYSDEVVDYICRAANIPLETKE